MSEQRTIRGLLIAWEVIAYGSYGMEQVAARFKDPWKAVAYCVKHNCGEVKLALFEPGISLPTQD